VEFSVRHFANVVVAAPTGRIDHVTASTLERELLPLVAGVPGASTGVVVDMEGVEYISSMGLRVLMVVAKQARSARVRIAVASLQPVVDEIFTISRFNAVLDVYTSPRSALEAISPAALAEFDATRRGAPT
jgi:anti-anti-sigma factor